MWSEQSVALVGSGRAPWRVGSVDPSRAPAWRDGDRRRSRFTGRHSLHSPWLVALCLWKSICAKADSELSTLGGLGHEGRFTQSRSEMRLRPAAHGRPVLPCCPRPLRCRPEFLVWIP